MKRTSLTLLLSLFTLLSHAVETVFTDVDVSHAVSSGVEGLNITFRLSVTDVPAGGGKLQVYAFLFDSADKFVKATDYNDKYRNGDGYITASQPFVMIGGVDAAQYEGAVFIPYAAMDLPSGSNSLKVGLWAFNPSTGKYVDSPSTPFGFSLQVPEKQRTDPYGVVNRTWLEHGVTVNGVKGMKVHCDATFHNARNRECEMCVWIRDADGKYLTFKDDTSGTVRYLTADFTPEYDHSTFSDMWLFIPSDRMMLHPGTHDYSVVATFDTKQNLRLAESHLVGFSGTTSESAPYGGNPNIDPENMKRLDEFFAKNDSKPLLVPGSSQPRSQSNPLGLDMEFHHNPNPFGLNMEFQERPGGSISTASLPRLKPGTYKAKYYVDHFEDFYPADFSLEVSADGNVRAYVIFGGDAKRKHLLYSMKIKMDKIVPFESLPKIPHKGVAYHSAISKEGVLLYFDDGEHRNVYFNDKLKYLQEDETDDDGFVLIKFIIEE